MNMNSYQRGGDVLSRSRKYGGGTGAGGSGLQVNNRNQHQMYKQQHALERQQHGGDIGGISTTYGVHNGDHQDATFGHHQMQQHNYLKKIERARERGNDEKDSNTNNPRIDRNALNALRNIGQSEGHYSVSPRNNDQNSNSSAQQYPGQFRAANIESSGSTLAPLRRKPRGKSQAVHGMTVKRNYASRYQQPSNDIDASSLPSIRNSQNDRKALRDRDRGGEVVRGPNSNGGLIVREVGGLSITTEQLSTVGVTSIKGLKPNNPNWINQDNFFVAENVLESEANPVHIYCVLDGHGSVGHLVSRRCREVFLQFIKAANLDMRRAFNMMQNDLLSAEFDTKCSGATCTLVMSINGKLACSNCGDSRAVLGRRASTGNFIAIPLSNDHKPDKPEERKRILNCGGHVGCRQVLVSQGPRGPVTMPVGPCRVWYQHKGDTLGLAMSRSLGDTIVHKCGVSAEPETLDHVLEVQDEFVIIATDGVWDVIDNNQAIQIVQNYAAKCQTPNWSPLEASNWICKVARGRWEKLSPMVDDISCIVIKIPATR